MLGRWSWWAADAGTVGVETEGAGAAGVETAGAGGRLVLRRWSWWVAAVVKFRKSFVYL